MFGNARKLLTGGKGSFGIMRNKKALTLLAGLGLAAGLVGGTTTASAASADSFTDVRKIIGPMKLSIISLKKA